MLEPTGIEMNLLQVHVHSTNDKQQNILESRTLINVPDSFLKERGTMIKTFNHCSPLLKLFYNFSSSSICLIVVVVDPAAKYHNLGSKL